MGRPKKAAEFLRTEVIQFRCTRAFKAEMEAMLADARCPDLTSLIEASVIEMRRKLRRKGPSPPR